MGMFDEVICKYPLPMEGANEHTYQTKDMNCELDVYEIREDGTLWHEDYDTEDQSVAGKWMDENPGKDLPDEYGLKDFSGMMTRVNKRWVMEEHFTGSIEFYRGLHPGQRNPRKH